MTFDEVLDQVRVLLQQRGRVTYRSLKLRYQLDDELLAGVTDELISAERVAVDEDGKVLVWIGTSLVSESTSQMPQSTSENEQPVSRLQPLDARPPAGERRQLTVEFIDLVGSTTLSQQLDPEDYHARVVAYQTACHQVIARYEGHIAQYLGDGVLVYFGYPAAHEEDAVRAVRSGLEIVAAVGQLKFTPPLQVRIGIHTGPVVVGEIGAGERSERLAVGETPNIAARVQGQAEPNTVVISTATYRLVHGFFRCEALGPQALKHVTAPLELYRVHEGGAAQSRFEVAVSAGLTPLVGREHEVGLLQERWERAKQGEGQVVLLRGEAGIGKSRLVQTLKEQAVAEGATRIEFRCSPYFQNTAFYPVIEHLQRLLQWRREDTPEEKLKKLEGALEPYGLSPREMVPLLAPLLSLPLPERYPPLNLSPQRQKQKTLEALLTWLLKETERQAVRFDIEDLHWADPSTLEFLSLLLDQVPTTRMLVVFTFRPEFIPPWPPHSHVTHITLSRLAHKQAEVMVERVTGGRTLPAEVVQQVVAKTDGVPLFVEELTKMVVESGLLRETDSHYELTSPLPPLAIPATLQGSLMARLDRLSMARETAQLGATLGREFSYELIKAVTPMDEASLHQALAKLVEAEVLYQRGMPPQARYLFKHALIQDAAYQSLLKSKRQQHHQQIAQVLEERFPETKEAQPELLAHHYTEAGLIAQAIAYWQKAGQRAVQRSGNVEAIAHLTKALELLQLLPDTPERTQQELVLQTTLGPALIATKSWAAPEVEKAYSRARELCHQLGEAPQLFPVLWGLWAFYAVRGDYNTAPELGEQLLSLAQSVQDPVLLLEAYYALGGTLVQRGELASARAHLEQGIALYDPQQHRSLAFLYGSFDPGVGSRSFAALALWSLGYPDLALERIQEALALAQELAHPFSLAYALGLAARLHQFRREVQTTQERAEAAIALATEQGFTFWAEWGNILRGWALVEQGDREGMIAQIRRGLTAYQATGAGL